MDVNANNEILYLLKETMIGIKDGDRGFEISLRRGEGLDMQKIDKTCGLLEEYRQLWENEPSIPKAFMELFLDFRIACDNSLGLYDKDEQIKIIDTIENVLDYVREIVKSSGSGQ